MLMSAAGRDASPAYDSTQALQPCTADKTEQVGCHGLSELQVGLRTLTLPACVQCSAGKGATPQEEGCEESTHGEPGALPPPTPRTLAIRPMHMHVPLQAIRCNSPLAWPLIKQAQDTSELATHVTTTPLPLLLQLLPSTQPTIEEPQPSAEDRHKRWLEQEVVRLTNASKDLEEQLLEAQSTAMDMASRIEQLEVSCLLWGQRKLARSTLINLSCRALLPKRQKQAGAPPVHAS